MLAMHKPFHLVLGMVIDVLHAVGVGTGKMLLNCWFSKNKKRERYSLYHKVLYGEVNVFDMPVDIHSTCNDIAWYM